MEKCAFQPCPVQIASVGANVPLFCTSHLAVRCKFSDMGQCKEFIMPNSGWCKTHNDEVVRFNFIHGIQHQQWALAQMEAEQNQHVLKTLGGNDKGPGGLHLLR